MDATLNGSIFGRQAKSIPADRVKNLVALHALEASQDIRYGVYAQMAQVQCARRVREHGQDIGLALCRFWLLALGDQLVPVRLPFGRQCLDLGLRGSAIARLHMSRP